MRYFSVAEAARRWGLSERSVRNYCAQGRIPGALLTGKTWTIPECAQKPARKRRSDARNQPLSTILQEEKIAARQGGIYDQIQVDLTYHSNHIEGNGLTHEQTWMIYELNAIGAESIVRVDDLVETANHFCCIALIADTADQALSERLIKQLHAILKNGTTDSRKEWFAIGDYKRFPNEVGGRPTVAPKDVPAAMKELLRDYHMKKEQSLKDLLDFHCRFERIHPFQDGNGRIGRLLLFKECLGADLVPFIITDDLKEQYYLGIQNWDTEPEILIDTCTLAQRRFLQVMADHWIVPNNWPEF